MAQHRIDPLLGQSWLALRAGVLRRAFSLWARCPRKSGGFVHRSAGSAWVHRTCSSAAKALAVTAQRSLTPRSNGPPTACHLGREAVLFIIGLAAKASHRWRPFNSNVRPHKHASVVAALLEIRP